MDESPQRDELLIGLHSRSFNPPILPGIERVCAKDAPKIMEATKTKNKNKHMIDQEDMARAHAMSQELSGHIVDAHIPRFIAYLALTFSAVNLMEETFGVHEAEKLGDLLLEALVTAARA
jgi:hypothetical protein